MQCFLHTVEKSGLFEPYDQRFDETRQTPSNKAPNKGWKGRTKKEDPSLSHKSKTQTWSQMGKGTNYVPKPH
jgi:hypothetical protein